ncbi:hypothetical protein SprV_0200674500 [Sparganum proliferum]
MYFCNFLERYHRIYGVVYQPGTFVSADALLCTNSTGVLLLPKEYASAHWNVGYSQGIPLLVASCATQTNFSRNTGGKGADKCLRDKKQYMAF